LTEKFDLTERAKRATRITWIALVTNMGLTAVKLAAGIMGQSAAIVSDAFHSLSDFATDIVILLGFRIIKKPADKTHAYGHGKFESLLSVIIALALFSVGLRILWTGTQSIIRSFQGIVIPRPGIIALYAAILSIFVKEILFRISIKVGKQIDSQAILAKAWHERSDAFSSVATLAGVSGAILFGEKWRVLDPVAAVFVSFFIIKIAISIFRDSINDLLEASLCQETQAQILEVIKSVPGAENPHNLRTRRIGSIIAIAPPTSQLPVTT